MEAGSKSQTSIFTNLRSLYFIQYIRINEEQNNSLVFGILIEIIRFALGNSFVYCVFMQKQFDSNVDQTLFFSFRTNQKLNETQSNDWIHAICWSMMPIVLVYLSAVFMNEKTQKKFKITKLIYYLEIFVKAISQYLFCIFGVVLFQQIQKENYFLGFLVTLQAILVLFLFRISAVYSFKNQFQTEDIYAHNNNLSVQANSTLLSIMCMISPFICLSQGPEVVQAGLVILWNCLQLQRLFQSVIYPYYQNQTIHKVYGFFTSLQTAQTFIYSVGNFLPLSMITQNQISIIGVITFFLFWGSLQFSQALVQQIYFLKVQDINKKQDIYLLINSLYDALKSFEKQGHSQQMFLIFSSIKRNHKNECKNSQCYCNNEQMTDLKNFIRFYLHQIVLKLQKNYQQDRFMMFYLYSLEFQMFHLYTRIYQQLQKLKEIDEMSSFQTFLLMKISRKLNKWVQNQNKKLNVVPIILAIRLEEDLQTINQIILSDIQTKYKKWNTLSKEISRFEEIRELSNKEIENLIKIENIKIAKWQDYNRSTAFNSVLHFYFKRIVMKAEGLIDLEQNMKNLRKKIKEQEFGKHSLFLNHLFHKNACTVESSIKENNFGVILKTSRSINEVFGYHYKKIIGQNVSCLVPQFVSNQHDKVMKKWVQSESKICNLSKVSQIYCKHQQNYCFIAHKYMHVYVGQSQITLITTFFKSHQKQLILINFKGQIEQFNGKIIKSFVKNIEPKTKCDFVFKDMHQKITNDKITHEKIQTTIMFPSDLTEKFLNQEKKVSETTQKRLKNSDKKRNFLQLLQSRQKQIPVWRINFTSRKVKMGTTQFFKVEVKKIQQLAFEQQILSLHSLIKSKHQIGEGEFSLGSDFKEEADQIIQQTKSIILESPVQYDIYRLISHFQSIMMNPSRLVDKKISRKFVLDVFFMILLIAILSTILIVNKFSFDEKIASLRAKASIDKVLRLVQVSTNHAINMYMYRNNEELIKIAIQESIWDQQRFFEQLKHHFIAINQQKTDFQGQQLYKYLKTPLNMTFKGTPLSQIEMMQFFEVFFYLFKDIRKQWSSSQPNMTQLMMSYDMLARNVILLRPTRDNLDMITEDNILNNNKVSLIFFIVTLLLFFLTSGVYFLYLNIYRKFRFDQNQNHFKIYEMVPQHLILNLDHYYSQYYEHYVIRKNRIGNVSEKRKENNDEYSLQQFDQSVKKTDNEMNVFRNGKSTLKLVGKNKHLAWFGILLLMLVLNGGNAIISSKMYDFNVEAEYFSKYSNQLSSSQATLMTRWLRLKATYELPSQIIDANFLDLILNWVQSVQVNFIKHATLQEDWVIKNQPLFRTEFNKLLTADPCILNQQKFNQNQLKICNQYTKQSKSGILIHVNSLSRYLRNFLLCLKSDINVPTLDTPAILTSKSQFREIDFVSTFHGQTFAKLNEKIIFVYQLGFDSEFGSYIAVFMCLIMGILANFGWNFWKMVQDRKEISYLYGYIMLVPSRALKQSQMLVNFIKKNLQFTEIY